MRVSRQLQTSTFPYLTRATTIQRKKVDFASIILWEMSGTVKSEDLIGSTKYGVPDCLSRRGGSGVDEGWGRLRRPDSSRDFPSEHPVFGGVDLISTDTS